MQTFLPYSRFDASAAVLDDLRLGKQRVETMQILRALVYPSYKGWKNHPATAQWRGFTDALVCYGLAMCTEWERRGRADAVGGVGVDNIPAYREAGASGFGIGSALYKPGRPVLEISKLARALVAAAKA